LHSIKEELSNFEEEQSTVDEKRHLDGESLMEDEEKNYRVKNIVLVD
jgi:DNA polymerase sigma